jgi:hypothetical protein
MAVGLRAGIQRYCYQLLRRALFAALARSLSAHTATAGPVGSAPAVGSSNLGAVAGNFQFFRLPGPGTVPEEQHTKAAGAQAALQSRVVVARAVGAEYVTTGAAVMPPPLPSEGAATTDVAASACISVSAPVSIPTPSRQRRGPQHPGAPFQLSRFLDKNRRDTGASQSRQPTQMKGKRLVIESRWVSTPLASAGELRPRRLNN